jgi:OmpA-OmpF porin, OOP family
MRKQLRVILLFAFLCSFCVQARTQNLVPNPSFENYSSCPNNLDQLYLAIGWYDVGLCTSDYFNSCNSLAVPQNHAGWQMPRTGNGYAGFGIYAAGNLIEYIGVPLLDTLVAGRKYCIEFYVSVADSSRWYVNRIGAKLSNTQLTTDCTPMIIAPSIEYPSNLFLTDTENWISISGIYTATGGESHLTIGNFYSDSLTDTIQTNLPFYGTYVYIDDASVTECPEPPPLVSSLIVPNAFSPNGDGINDFFSPRDTNLSFYTCKIYNRWGNLIFETTNPNQFWDGNYNGGECVEGTYFYLVEAIGLDDKKYLYKGFLMLAR